MDWRRRPSIIVVKGYPYTGKTTIAVELAKHHQHCMLISLDEILDPITPPPYSSFSRPGTEQAEQLISQAFDILCRVAETQLKRGLSVIIDSQLSSRDQLDDLLCLLPSSSLNATNLVIINCWFEIGRDWESRFEENLRKNCSKSETNKPDSRWYKPQDWEEVKKLIESYHEPEPIQGVSRLLLNVDRPFQISHVIQAVQTLILCEDHHNLDYHKWIEYHIGMMKECKYPDPDLQHCHDHQGNLFKVEKELIVNSGRHIMREKVRFCKDGHALTLFVKEDRELANCGICEKPVTSGAAYACSSCALLALHKSCAEMGIQITSFTPKQFPTFIIRKNSAYSFPESHACLICREAGQNFSDECASCIFESHLKCHLIPTIIGHVAHEHKLYFWATTIDQGKGQYKCAACGTVGAYVAYRCDGCDWNCHVGCALLPYTVMLPDGILGKHLTELRFAEEKDGTCRICFKEISLEEWYYSSRLYDRERNYHLRCVFAKVEKISSSSRKKSLILFKLEDDDDEE